MEVLQEVLDKIRAVFEIILNFFKGLFPKADDGAETTQN